MCTNQKYYVPLDQKGVDVAEYINKPSFLLGLLVWDNGVGMAIYWDTAPRVTDQESGWASPPL